MKTYTKNLKIVKIERINSSCNGNPAYKMLVEDENGKQYEGRTASDAAIAYKLSTSDINQIYNIQYHYTKNDNIIFDYVCYKMDIKSIEEEIINLQNICERLKNDNEYTKIYKKTLKKIEELKKELSELKKADRITLYTFSDVGSVKIGNDKFNVLLPNGYGDGCTTVLILGKNEEPRGNNHYICTIKGDYCIYSYDLGDEVIYQTHGKYNIYNSHNGVVVFKKISD